MTLPLETTTKPPKYNLTLEELPPRNVNQIDQTQLLRSVRRSKVTRRKNRRGDWKMETNLTTTPAMTWPQGDERPERIGSIDDSSPLEAVQLPTTILGFYIDAYQLPRTRPRLPAKFLGSPPITPLLSDPCGVISLVMKFALAAIALSPRLPLSVPRSTWSIMVGCPPNSFPRVETSVLSVLLALRSRIGPKF